MVAIERGSALNDPVLVLNKGWSPIDACTAREALTDVVGQKALIIGHDECQPDHLYVPHDIFDWMEVPVAGDDRYIATARSRIIVPEVIVQTEYNKIPPRTVVFSRRNLWKRDSYRCQYCGKRPKDDEITVDHVVPRAIWNRQNHSTSVSCFENCVLACVDCNKKKDNRTPEQANMPLRRMINGKDGRPAWQYYKRPKAPSWSPIYAIKRYQQLPESWSKFIQDMVSELYWTIELED